MAWATISVDATWASRMAQKTIRPAVFVYLDWPGAEIRASTHNKNVTTIDPSLSPVASVSWTGVGNVARIEASDFKRSGTLVSYTLGLTSLPQGTITDATEAAAIGRRCRMYLGLFDEGWTDPILHQTFIGHIISAGDFKHSRDKSTGLWVTDASIEVSNGRSPRRALQKHHSPATAEGNDTGWNKLPSAGRAIPFPAD